MSLDKQILDTGNNTLDRVVHEWAKSTAEKFQKQIQKTGMSVTEELLQSMQYRVETGDNPGIVFTFKDYGAYRDMKFLFFSKHPPVDKLEEWVKRKGINFFGYVPGYGEAGLQRDDAAARIAWGIAKNFSSGEKINNWAKGKKQRSVWQQPVLGKAVAHLAHLLAENIAEEAGKEIIKPFIR